MSLVGVNVSNITSYVNRVIADTSGIDYYNNNNILRKKDLASASNTNEEIVYAGRYNNKINTSSSV